MATQTLKNIIRTAAKEAGIQPTDEIIESIENQLAPHITPELIKEAHDQWWEKKRKRLATKGTAKSLQTNEAEKEDKNPQTNPITPTS